MHNLTQAISGIFSRMTADPDPDPGARTIAAGTAALPSRAPTVRWLVRALILIGLLVFFIEYAQFRDVHRNFLDFADSDLLVIYEALRLNSGLPQHDVVHTGYLHYLLVSFWYRAAHSLGFLPIDSLRELYFADNYLDLWNRLTVSGRYFAASFAACYVFAVYLMVEKITKRDWIATFAASIIFATSFGLAAQAPIIRVELTASFFCFLCFAFLVLAARARGQTRALVYIFLGTFCGGLAILTKIQSFIVLATFPGLFLVTNGFADLRPAGCPGSSQGMNSNRPVEHQSAAFTSRMAVARFVTRPIVVSIAALALLWVLVVTVVGALSRGSTSIAGYQLALYAYLIICFALLARWRGTQLFRAAQLFAAACLGAVAVMLVQLYRNHPGDWEVMWNFVEAMSHFARRDMNVRPDALLADMLGPTATQYLAIVKSVLDSNSTFFPFALALPATAYEWIKFTVISLAAVVAATTGRSGLFRIWWAACLCGLALFLEVVFRLRKFYPMYWILVEIWPILAITFLLERRPAESHRFYYLRAVICLICVLRIVPLQVQDFFSPKALLQDPTVCGMVRGYLAEFRWQFGC